MLEAAYKDTLFVISDEMRVTLGDIKSALELAIETNDNKHLSMVRELMSIAKGALVVIDFKATALLATEMIKVIDLILENKTRKREAALDALSSGVLLLPAFFTKTVESEGTEQSIALLPVLQELRLARGAKPLSEETLTLLDIRGATLSDKPLKLPKIRGKKDLALEIGKYRPAFQSALLGWIKKPKLSKNLARLSVICEKFEQAARQEYVYKVWWITGGLIEALTAQGLTASPELRQLFGKVDRMAKTVLDRGEDFYQDDPDPGLIDQLLHFAGSSTSSGKRIIAIRKAFSAHDASTLEEKLDAAKLAMAAPDTEVMQSLILAIREDLDKVKDTLDIFNRTGSKDNVDLEKRFASLKKIADTLQMLGLHELQERVLQQQKEITDALSRDEPLTDNHLIAVAASLLQVETTLEKELDRLAGKKEQKKPKYLLDALAVSFLESKVNIARVKEVISQFMRDPTDLKPISRAPVLLKEARAASLLADKERLAAILAGLQDYITRQLIGSGRLPYPEHLDLLAGAIESVDFYLETLNKGRRDPWYMLDNAESCLGQLLRTAPAPLTRDKDQRPSLERTVQLPHPKKTKAVADTLAMPALTSATVKRMQKQTDMTVDTHPDAYPIMDKSLQSDPEVIEIFIEEANEVQQNIEREFQVWRADNSQRDAMVAVRRGFHTLKGSGRMVGAKRLSELAWQAEHLMNRFLEGMLTLGADGAHLLERVVVVIPILIEQLEIGAETKEDAHQLMISLESFTAQKLQQPADRNDITHLPGEIDAEPGRADTHGGQTATTGGQASGPSNEKQTKSDSKAKVIDMRSMMTPQSAADSKSAPSGTRIQDARGIVDDGGLSLLEDDLGPDNSASQMSRSATEAKIYKLETALYEIYRDESANHLEVIREFCRDSVGEMISDKMHRAVHTLHGTANMADISPIIKLTAEFEHYVQRLYDSGLALEQEAVPVVGEVVDMVERMVASVNHKQPMPEVSTDLMRALHALRMGIDQRILQRADANEAGIDADTGANTGAEIEIEAMELGGELDDILIVADAHLGEEEPVVENEPTLGAVDSEITDIFLDEAREILSAADAVAATWNEGGLSDKANAELQRYLHTLKGGARMAGLLSVGDFTHETESFLIALRDKPVAQNETSKRLLRSALDHMHKMLDEVQNALPPSAALEVLHAMQAMAKPASQSGSGAGFVGADKNVSGSVGPLADDAADFDPFDDMDETLFFDTYAEEALPLPPHAAVPQSGSEIPQTVQTVISSNTPAEGTANPATTGLAATLHAAEKIGSIFEYDSKEAPVQKRQQDAARISTDNLETLLNQAGEVSIFRSRIEQELSNSNLNLVELSRTVQRLKAQLRTMEIETEATILYQHRDESDRDDFDPLEMDRYSNVQQVSRALAESVNDLSSLESLLEHQFRDTEALLLQQSRVMTDLQDNLMRVRMIPFARYAPRYARIVRQIATETGKKVELHVSGAESEIDRQVIERMQAPLEHMIRNAVIHGIESPAERKAAGKDPEGSINLHLSREGAQLLLELKDDGAGLDFARIREKALDSGLLTHDQAVTDADLAQLILNTGFSTAEAITQSAGRGVGMDVVASEVKQLGGSLQISSGTGKGTRFLMRLPFTRAINHALLVRVGDENYAIPLHKIDGVAKMPLAEVKRLLASKNPSYQYANLDYDIKNLSRLVGSSHWGFDEDAEELSLIMVTGGDHRAALLVSELLGSREMVIKPVGPQVAAIRGISGATILGDGRIVVILDMDALLGVRLQEIKSAALPVQAALSQPLILVVDDSITVRRVTERLLERNKIQVLTARDGLDALNILQDHLPDLILLDIEMPRMDGYELAEHVRKDMRTLDIPIIMITSRTGDKHRSRAIEVGVDDYLGKPYREDQLLEAIKPLLAAKHVA